MENKEPILQELQDIAPLLAEAQREMLYTVPEGYFDILPLTVLGKVVPVEKTWSVPEGYFDALPGILLAKVKSSELADELEEIAPLLKSINRQMPYELPAGYFETLDITAPEVEAPVIQLRPKRKMGMWAVAASVIVLAGLFSWGYWMQNRSGTNGTTDMADSEQVSPADSISTAELAAALSQMEDKSIDAELNDYGYTEENGSPLYYLNTVNFEKALQDISDEEIASNLELQVSYNKKS